MGREIKRVPLDFDWPQDEVWHGYRMPQKMHETPCLVCHQSGFSQRAQELSGQWYGSAPFDPASTGSTPYTVDTPELRAFAEHNVSRNPDYYGTGERAILAEAGRLAGLFNSEWMHHLTQDDVDALLAQGRLSEFTHTWDPKQRRQVPIEPTPTVTAEQVNRRSISPGTFLHDSISRYIVVADRCRREGVPDECPACDGHGNTEAYPGQRAEIDAWERTEPPTGDGWQLWETVTEGSPISPVFTAPEELARWMVSGASKWTMPQDYESALGFVKAGWAPTMVVQDGVMTDGVTFVGSQQHDGAIEEENPGQ